MSQAPVLTNPVEGEPVWDLVSLFPSQGNWGEGDFLDLDTNHLIELTDGRLEVLPMPTMAHQLIVALLYRALLAFVESRKLGTVLFAPMPVRVRRDALREPDVLFMRAEHAGRISNKVWDGADLVMQVVSDRGRQRDLEEKRLDYAEGQIPEYWIVDPQEARITVLKLVGGQYEPHGVFTPGTKATSALLPGFEVDVAAALRGG